MQCLPTYFTLRHDFPIFLHSHTHKDTPTPHIHPNTCTELNIFDINLFCSVCRASLCDVRSNQSTSVRNDKNKIKPQFPSNRRTNTSFPHKPNQDSTIIWQFFLRIKNARTFCKGRFVLSMFLFFYDLQLCCRWRLANYTKRAGPEEHWKLDPVRYFPAFESIDSVIYSLADVLFFDANPWLGAVEDKTIATLLFPEDKCIFSFFRLNNLNSR